MLDLIIRGGLVVDPATETEKIASVAISGNRISGIFEVGEEPEAAQVIDATGCIVTPGLIDSHLHVFYTGTENGIIPDMTLLPMGVTAAVDQGSAGSANFPAFYDSVIANAQMHVYATVNVSTQGLVTSRYVEDLNPKNTNIPALEKLFDRYKDVLTGIKVRISQELVGELGLAPLDKALEVAEKVGSRISVHTTNPPVPVSELIAKFRAGDIYSHVFQGRGYSILGEDGKILPEVWEARKRGVVMDAADARVHYTFPMLKQAISEGFYPDTISTDLVAGSLFQPGAFGLPRKMSAYLELGMPLKEIIRATTIRAAEVIEKDKEIGALKNGMLADVAIFKIEDAETVMTDRLKNDLVMHKLFVPQCTILGGKVVYRQLNF